MFATPLPNESVILLRQVNNPELECGASLLETRSSGKLGQASCPPASSPLLQSGRHGLSKCSRACVCVCVHARMLHVRVLIQHTTVLLSLARLPRGWPRWHCRAWEGPTGSGKGNSIPEAARLGGGSAPVTDRGGDVSPPDGHSLRVDHGRSNGGSCWRPASVRIRVLKRGVLDHRDLRPFRDCLHHKPVVI